MAEPTQNYVHLTAISKVFQDTANDKSIASAVQKTGSTLYTNIQDLADNAVLALMNTTHNPSKITPTNLDHFRGYPKPTIDMNWEEVRVGSYPSEQYEYAACLPVMNNKVGFDVVVNVNVREILPDLTEDDNDHVFTFSEGGTSCTCPTLSTDGSGRFILNETYQQPTVTENIVVENTVTSTNYLTYLTPLTYNTTLNYTAETVAYEITNLNKYLSSSCGSTCPTATRTGFYTTTSATLVAGRTIYTDATLTTPVTFTTGAANATAFDFDRFTLVSGVVSSFTNCLQP